MEKIAVFAGSFDPFTLGHESVVLRSADLFDKIFVAVGVHSGKKPLMKIASRVRMIRDVFAGQENIVPDYFEGLTVDYCRRVNATHMLRGIRTAADFEYERAVAQINKRMLPEVESIFLLTSPEHTPINSTLIRDIIRNGGDASQFLPAGIDIRNYL
ncbi:MAG TPA: pantetheine-phosphate adenylyltransferase [Bacteroidaceae bacterium]|nr:pantetheine-phosphate adenylyltransferase [Bacteroidaceae bacterium]